MSRLIQPRGLKYYYQLSLILNIRRGLYSLVDWNTCRRRLTTAVYVEAYTASWIEILFVGLYLPYLQVEAYTASWIEISLALKALKVRRRGLYSLVDWNIFGKWGKNYAWRSRLIQPRGLKWDGISATKGSETSRLIQPRGLKCFVRYISVLMQGSRLIQPRGLKYITGI